MRPIRKIIIHHSLTKDSDTLSWGAIRRYHLEQGFDGVGYHAGAEIVNKHLEILKGRFHIQQGAHTKGHNWDSLAACAVGNFDIDTPHPELYDLLARLCREWLEIYSLDIDDVHPHSEYASYKSCPGRLFDMQLLKEFIKD